jgi:GT2 family glycosyltransferase
MYNASRHLRECIDSILAQTFEDFELLIVDDGYNYAADLQRMGFIYVYNDCRIGAAVSSKTRPYQTTSTHHERKQLQPLPAR